MPSMITVKCANKNTYHEYPLGTTLKEISEDHHLQLKGSVLGAIVNYTLKELSYEIYKPKTIQFIDYTHPDGRKMYIRSLSMLLFKAVNDLLPGKNLKIDHAISNGIYCEIQGIDLNIEEHFELLMRIKERMFELVKADLPFIRKEYETEKAYEIFKKCGLIDKCELLETRTQVYTSVYQFDDIYDYFYGHLVPSSSYLKYFDLIKYYDGMLLVFPQKDEPKTLQPIILQDKLFDIFREHKEWAEILDVPWVGRLNKIVQEGKISELIKIAEALQEKKLAQIADKVHTQGKNTRIILISGPSSSGKTTFSKRLAIQLRVLGLKPIQISLDNYFVEREKTPLDEHGDYDYENPLALDLDLFKTQMNMLMDGKEVLLPKFSFTNGSRYHADKKLVLHDENILIIEGIHALNPLLHSFIPSGKKFKIYVSALTQLGIDSHNRIPTTDNRLLRRMIRDNLYRGYSAEDTISRWPSVRAGEDKYIFPFQEEADIMFNTALIFELGILKKYAEPLLREIPKNKPIYSEAVRLLKFLSYFVPINEWEIPPTSILREFLEGSSFEY